MCVFGDELAHEVQSWGKVRKSVDILSRKKIKLVNSLSPPPPTQIQKLQLQEMADMNERKCRWVEECKTFRWGDEQTRKRRAESRRGALLIRSM